ncbi:MAG: rod shape-determining protein MreC [Bacteriovoracaceae bacterium]|nr:rod shape-determining protein MreC [Bacteriovoracaceae bacterium]
MRILEDENYRWKVAINVVVLGFSLFCVSRERPPFDETSAFERFMIDSLAPVQTGVSSMKRGAGSFFDDYVANLNASQKNRDLTKEIANLQSELFRFTEVAKENARLKELLQFGQEIKRKRVLAQIVAWDASSNFKSLRINKGASDGILLQSTVVTSEGLVGYVYRLTEHFADIVTILDANTRIDGIVERTRSHGIIEGMSKQRCSMKYVTRTEPVELNDLVLTSGLGNVFPKGIRVGYVAQIERESYGISQNIEIVPSVNFSRLEEVIVLVSPGNSKKIKEWEALDNPTTGGGK